MTYHFDGRIAAMYGVDEAVFIAMLQFWIAKTKPTTAISMTAGTGHITASVQWKGCFPGGASGRSSASSKTERRRGRADGKLQPRQP